MKKSEAHTLITLEDARTTEQLYIAEGVAEKSDLSFGGGGGFGGWSGSGPWPEAALPTSTSAK